ncbi:MAG: GDYXXLXY domain-containing protein [Gammaproteobacteria bacterium]|nr:GDYXXLXY domain-containing protein [Gammaproteobacteria bacterium]
MRRLVALLAGLAILAAVNWTVWQRERLVTTGRVVLLELAPVDPRSLMQGDYMALRFHAANEAFGPGRVAADAADGHLVLRLDEKGVAQFVRLDDATPLAADEIRMRFRVRGGTPKLATNAFFFEEGSASRYAEARYGEFRVDGRGEAILTGLRDRELRGL